MTTSTTSEYIYRDTNGDPSYKVIVDRSDPKEKRVLQAQCKNDGWIYNMDGVHLIPYRLREALQSVEESRPLFVVEGEKDVESLVRHGCTATTNTGGATKWKDVYSEMLYGGTFVLVGDNDKPGRDHIKQVARSLAEFANPKSLKVIDLCVLMPTLPLKGDITDFLELGGSIDSLLAAVEAATEWNTGAERKLVYPAIDLNQLPFPIAEIVAEEIEPQDQLTVLLSCLVALGSVLDNIFTVVGGRRFYPNFNLMIVGPPATGKGLANVGRDLVRDVHRSRVDESKQLFALYEAEVAALSNRKQKNILLPPKPPTLALFAAGNSTGPVILDLLASNKSLLIHESEADVSATLLRSDYFDLSGVIRQCWSHEHVSYARVKLDNNIDIRTPKLSMCLSGTPGQVVPFFRQSENGLVSRFTFHVLTSRSSFRNPWDNSQWKSATVGLRFASVTRRVNEVQSAMMDGIEILFTEAQRERLYSDLQSVDLLLEDEGDYMTATMRRSSVLIARIASILTVMRSVAHNTADLACNPKRDSLGGMVGCSLIVDDRDCETAAAIAKYSLDTAQHLQSYLPRDSPQLSGREHPNTLQWYEALPSRFERSEAVSIGEEYGMSGRTIDRLLSKSGLFERTTVGQYSKRARGELAT
ncbi:MAG: DUF3987 domain-containing protein [Ignavibacteria bacterium]|nr:DUF3987 domain-containing protein [Ignavibacteria bacterium]